VHCLLTFAPAIRNYPCDNQITAFFGSQSLDEVGVQAFQNQLYLCMMSQTLWMKGQIESIRYTNSFGTLIWQLNENWPTGGWGCVEYGSREKQNQQVIGGRWKPLIYLLLRDLFQDVVVACGEGGRCYARNDGPDEVDVFVSLEAWSFNQAKSLNQIEWYPHLKPGRSTGHFILPASFRDNADAVLIDVREGNEPNGLRTSAFLWNSPRNIHALSHVAHISIRIRRGDDGTVALEVSSDALALYVWLSTIAVGQFSDNAFHLRPGQRKIVRFEKVPGHEASFDIDQFDRTLRVEHLGSHRNQRVNESLPLSSAGQGRATINTLGSS